MIKKVSAGLAIASFWLATATAGNGKWTYKTAQDGVLTEWISTPDGRSAAHKWRVVDAGSENVIAARLNFSDPLNPTWSGTLNGAPAAGSITEQYVFARVLVTVINEAALARDDGVATQADIDTAMRLGTNYPRGPLEWAGQIGRHTCAGLLRALDERNPEPRFTPAAWLTGHAG